MAPAPLQLQVRRFSPQVLTDTIRTSCQAADGWKPTDQVRYLAAYLAHEAAGARTILVEQPYVDRHYIEEFSRYYATALRRHEPHTTRLHFFSSEYAAKEFFALLDEAARGLDDYESVRKLLSESYLGFCAIRPIPSAPIGRTVLRPYGDRSNRAFLSASRHSVHLCGVELTVDGVPFQQQELAVGACATTAVWSALAAASRAMGRRAPTPFEVTDAATRHVVNDRPFPADTGLDLQQVLDAVRAHGFAPYTIKPGANPEMFSMAVKAYLASGTPVVLLVHEPSGYHAVTAVGYREPDEEQTASDLTVIDGSAVLSSTGMSRVYVHEDRLGPYSRMTWTIKRSDDDCGVWLEHAPFEGAKYAYGTDKMRVYSAIAPLYPKLRLSSLGLIKAASELVPVVKRWLGTAAESLSLELRFQLSGDYIRELLTSSLEPAERIAQLARTAVLPRYVARARLSVSEGAFLDAVFDTTDILRDQPAYGQLLALVALVPSYVEQVAAFTKTYAPNALSA